MGFGVQGAVYRFQITANGESIIPVTTEFAYVFSGLITGKTALSIILWTMGTIILAFSSLMSLIYWNRISEKLLRILMIITLSASIFYMLSIMTQYGYLFNGPAGRSIPAGLFLILVCIGFGYQYRELIVGINPEN